MSEEMRTFGYLCPECGKPVMAARSVFALEASNAQVECSCGKSALTVTFDDRAADYDFTQLNELEPAYAMTVHKSQGSEYRAVILTAWNGSPYLLSRSILYTAITRARELLIIVGREETVAAMVENAKKNRRYTGLKLRLQGKTE